MDDRLATIDMGREVGGGVLCPFLGEELHRRLWAEAYISVTSGILIHPALLATTDMGRKLERLCHLGEQGPNLTRCGQGRGLPPYQVAS